MPVYVLVDDIFEVFLSLRPKVSLLTEKDNFYVFFVTFMLQKLRQQNLFKAPGVAETIDWAQALVELNCVALDPQMVDSTMGVLLKYQDDIARIQGSEAARLLAEVQAELVTSSIAAR